MLDFLFDERTTVPHLEERIVRSSHAAIIRQVLAQRHLAIDIDGFVVRPNHGKIAVLADEALLLLGELLLRLARPPLHHLAIAIIQSSRAIKGMLTPVYVNSLSVSTCVLLPYGRGSLPRARDQ